MDKLKDKQNDRDRQTDRQRKVLREEKVDIEKPRQILTPYIRGAFNKFSDFFCPGI